MWGIILVEFVALGITKSNFTLGITCYQNFNIHVHICDLA